MDPIIVLRLCGITMLCGLAEAFMCNSNEFNNAYFPPPPLAGQVLTDTGVGTAAWVDPNFQFKTFDMVSDPAVNGCVPNNGRVYDPSIWGSTLTSAMANPNPIIINHPNRGSMNLLDAMAGTMRAEIHREIINGLCDQATRKKEEIEQGIPPVNLIEKCDNCGFPKGDKSYCENETCERSPSYRPVTVASFTRFALPLIRKAWPAYMPENEPTEEPAPVKTGDVVWSAITGNGPFVIVRSAIYEIENIDGKSRADLAMAAKSNADFEKILTDDLRVEAWLVKDRYGRYLTVPISEVTKAKPRRHLFMIIWAWIYYIFYIRRLLKKGI
jgi:hypothetical protein